MISRTINRRTMALLESPFNILYLWIISYGYYYLFVVSGIDQLYSYLLVVAYTVFVMFSHQALTGNIGRVYTTDIRYIRQIICWSMFYVLYILLQSLRLASHQEVIHALLRNVGVLTMMWCAAYLIVVFSSIERIALVTAITVLFGVCMNILDFVDPTFSDVPGRSAGLYSNPNISGQLISMFMVIGVMAVPQKLKIYFMLFCGLGVFLTFSRGAWALWGLGFVYWLMQSRHKVGYKSMLAFGFALALGLSAVFLLFSGTIGSVVANTPVSDYLTSNTMARLGNGSPVLSGASAEARGELVQLSLGEWSEAAIFGRGFGYTSVWPISQRPHNMYLIFLVEGGIVGACIYLTLLVMLWRISTGTSRVLTLQYAASSIFTHNNLEQPAVAVILSFIVASSLLRRRSQNILANSK